MELLSINNFEDILFYLCQFDKVYKVLIERLLYIIFSSRTMFGIFNGYLVIEKIIDKSLKEQNGIEEQQLKNCLAMAKLQIFGKEFADQAQNENRKKEIDQIWNNDQKLGQIQIRNNEKNDIEDQLVNYYKCEKITFFTFLKKSQKNEQNNKYEKQEFLAALSSSQQIKLEYLYMILEQQQGVSSNNTLNSPLLNGFKVEALKNLLILITFKEALNVGKALKYFINYNPQAYESIDMNKVQIEIQKIIDIEQTIASIQLPNTIPFQFQKLLNLFINQTFQTKIPINSSIYSDLFNYLKFEVDQVQIYSQEKNKNYELIPLFSSGAQKLGIFQNIKKLVPFSEKFIRMMFSSNQKLRNQAINDVILKLYPAPNNNQKHLAKNHQFQVKSLTNFIAGMMDNNYEAVLEFLIQFCEQINDVQQSNFFLKVIAIVRGFVTIDTIQDNDTSIKQLIWATQQLKYFLSSDLDAFMELLQIYFNTLLNTEKPNNNVIRGLFSLMTPKPDYELLTNIFDLDEETLKFGYFLIQAIFSDSKSEILADPKVQKLIEKNFAIKDINPLIELSDILVSKTMDSKALVTKLKLEQNPLASKLFQSYFALKRQMTAGDSWKQLQDNYNLLAEQRAEIFKQIKDNKKQQQGIQTSTLSQPEILEVLHWFSNPRPTQMLYLLSKIQILDQQEPAAIFMAAIGAIGKYDRFDTYLEKQPEAIRNRADTLQKLSQKSIDKALLFIAQSSDQDLQEAFSMLQLVTGINTVLISAIFNSNIKNNACLEQVLSTQSIGNQEIIKLCLIRFDSFEESNMSAINQIRIIEYETLKNAQSEKLSDIKQSYLKSLNLQEREYQILENFLIENSTGKLAQSFPISSFILIFALKHLREIKKSKDVATAKYIKGQYCINIAFTVFEKYLFFYDSKNLPNLNKPALVKLLTIGLFDTNSLRCSKQQVDFVKLEGMLYPGLSDPFLEVRGTLLNFLTSKFDNQAENFAYQYNDYCQIFYRILPRNEGEQAENREEFNNYNELWCQVFTGKPLIQNVAMLYQSSMYKGQQEYYEQLSKKISEQKISLQYLLVAKFQQININQFSFIRSKYWDKSMELLKRLIFKPSEIDVLESDQSSEQTQQIMIALLQYYAGQYTVSQQVTFDVRQQQSKQNQTNSSSIEPLIGQVEGQSLKPKFRGSKTKNPIDLNVLIDNLLGLTLNDNERKELKPLVNLFYNPKSMDTEFISKSWGNDKTIMDAILIMLIRIQLEQAKSVGKFSQFAKKVPACYLYYSLGDQFENLSKEDLNQFKKNSDQMNQGIDELIQDCNEIQPSIKAPLKLMIRCYLGDVEAWYSLIAFTRQQESVHCESLSERMIRTFIIELLLQFKNAGLRSPKIDKQQLTSQSFGQLLKQLGNKSLMKIIETSLMNTFVKDNKQEIPIQTIYKIMQFLEFVFEGKTEVLADQDKSGFLQILILVLKIESSHNYQRKLINAIQFILQLLFKGTRSNHFFQLFEKNIELSNDDRKAWEFTKAIIEVDHSKDLNVLILKAYQILEQNNLKEYFQYLNLLISISSINYINQYPSSGIDDQKVMSVLMYPIVWLGSQLETQESEVLFEFKTQSNQFLAKLAEYQNDFLEILNQYYLLSNKEVQSQSAITDYNVEFYKRAFQTWCQQTNQYAMQQFFGFMRNDVLNIQAFPSSLKVLIDTLISLIFNKKLNQDPDQKLLKQLIDELTKIDPLDKQKDVIKAIIIMFSGLSEAKDIKGQKFVDAINTLLSKHNSEVGEIIKIIFAFYQSENIDSLKELPLKIQKGCFNDPVYKQKLENLPLAQLFQIASNAQLMIKKLEDSKQINETELLQMVKPVLEPMFGQKQDKELNILIKCIEAIIAIKNKRFNEVTSEFFQVMKISQSNSQLLIGLMKDFQLGLKSPQQLIKEKMASLVNSNTVRTMQYMNSVMTKLSDNRELQYEDMFRVLDKNGQRQVKASEVIEFLRRINIEITEHKFREVIVTIKGDQVNLQTCVIDFYEFKEIMFQISVQTMFLSLEYLGISKPLLIRTFIVLVIYLVVVLAFILIGVQAFAIPGTLAAIVNAALPIIGGLGLNKQAAEEKLKALNLTAILDVVKKAIKVIQSRRI